MASPLGGVLEGEASAQAEVYSPTCQLYIEFYSMLSDRERRALHLVEVEGVSYREAAAELGIKLENLKMVIFRARRKIHRAMRRVFDGSQWTAGPRASARCRSREHASPDPASRPWRVARRPCRAKRGTHSRSRNVPIRSHRGAPVTGPRAACPLDP